MAETIGYAALQIIPSLEGLSKNMDKQLGGLKVIGKSAGKDLGVGISDGAEAGIKKLGDTYAKQYDKMKDAAGKLRTEEQKLQDLRDKGVTGGRLVAQTERAEKARRDEARAVRESTEAYKDLEAAQKRVDDGGSSGGGGFLSRMKEAASGAGSAGQEAASGFLDGMGGPLAALGSKAGPIGLALTAAVALGAVAGGLIGKQLMQGIENEAQGDKIQARFGLDEATMKTFGDAAGKAYAANFGESISGNIEAAAAALQNGLLPKGSDDATTQAAIEKLSTVADILGVEIPEAARSTGQLMRTGFAKDFTEAADLIVSGSQSGLNISEDWLDTVNEYSTQFRKLGLSGPEALGLLSQAIKGGARDTDVAADALKEFSIRSVDNSKSTTTAYLSMGYSIEKIHDVTSRLAQGGQLAHDAFGQVIADVKNVQDPFDRGQIAVGLFGTKAEDLGDALNSFDLSTATQQLNEVDGAAQRASDTMGNNTASSIESAKRNIELGATTFQNALAKSFGPALQGIATWISEHQGDIENFFSIAALAAQQFASQFLQVSGGIISAFGNVVAALGDGAGFILDAFESVTGGLATIADAVGADGMAGKLRFAQGELGGLSDKLHNFGEGTIAFGDKLSQMGQDFGNLGARVGGAVDKVDNLRTSIGELNNTTIAPKVNLDVPLSIGNAGTRPPGRARGGQIFGPGTGTSDSILAWLSNEEFIVNADATRKNLPLLEAINSGKLPGFATGGLAGPDVDAARNLLGTPYSKGNRTDCSGLVARVINAALGNGGGGLMTTKNAEEWLAARGFKPGTGGPGDISVGWYDHGPGQDDGHMAMTLSDGTNAEAGGKNSVFTLGAGASGASSAQFDRHMFLTVAKKSDAGPVVGEGPEVQGAPPPKSSSGPGGGGASLPSSISGLASFGLEGLGITTQASENSPQRTLDLGGAASAAVGGQVASALGVFGINDSPGFLKAAGMLVSGISVSDNAGNTLFDGGNLFGGGGSSAPLSAASIGGGAIPPDDAGNVHGTRAGQPIGPTYNITARDTEDAFVKAQRQERERAAAKLARFGS